MCQTQKYVILEALHCDRQVTLPELMNLKCNGMRIANITGRISDLRKDGWEIKNGKTFDRKKKCFISSYFLHV